MSDSTDSWNPKTIIHLLLRCGEIALKYYNSPSARLKEDRSIVTEADHEVEALLESHFDRPQDGSYIIGEETIDAKDPGYIEAAFQNTAWVVDPIDGTAPYAHHIPTWGISIARMVRGVLTDGGIYLPVTGEVFLTDGDRVRYGTMPNPGFFDEDSITWADIEPPNQREQKQLTSMIALSQGIAKGSGIRTRKPVQALGCAVVPLTYIMLDRYHAYTGKVKLWDIAGALPMLLRLGFLVQIAGGEPVTLEVDKRIYNLDRTSRDRWKIRKTMMCAATEEALSVVKQTMEDEL